MTVCPYCKTPLSAEASRPLLRERHQRIYDAVAAAGPQGIDREDLLVRMYAEEEMPTPGGFTVLRVCICDMNKVLREDNQRVVNAFRGRYRLISIERPINEAEVQSAADTEGSHGDPPT